MISRRSAAGVVSLLIGLVPAAGFAQAPAGHAPAQASSAEDVNRRFDNAVRLYKEDKIAEALPEFERLAVETDSPNARLYVGYCLSKLGRPVEAYRAFSQTVSDIGKREDERYDSTRQAAWSELATLTPRVGKLVVALAEIPPGLRWSVDGTPMDASLLGTDLILEPGDHRVDAAADGMTPVRRDVHVGGGESKTITFALESPRVEPQPAPVVAAPAADHGATLRTLGFVGAGLGIAGFTVFTFAGLSAKGVHDDLEAECPSGCTDSAHRDDVARGKAMQTVANVGLVGGVVASAAGGVLLWLGFSSEQGGTEVGWRDGGGTLSYRGEF